MGTTMRRVRLVAGWAGWCSPCAREDRPLVLTRSGPGGLRSWLAGLSDDDRLLLLTCRVCGQWQVVPAREEDDPEAGPAPEPATVVPVPAPRAAVREVAALHDDRATLPAFSPEAVAGAARVLSAARAALPVPAPRRASCAAVEPVLPKVLGLPAGTRSVVLAPAT